MKPITINATLPPEIFTQILAGKKRMIIHKRNPRIDRFFDAKTPERAVINDRESTISRRITRVEKTETEYRIHLGIEEADSKPHLMTMEEWVEFATGNKKGLKIHDEKTLLELMKKKPGNKPRRKKA